MLLRIVLVILVLIAAVLAYAATRPKTVRITRSIVIGAPRERIFELINDFHQWVGWAPQDREDPSMVRTFSGPANGVGAVSEWAGKGSSGQGRMSITESKRPDTIAIMVDFVKPFDAHNLNRFTLEPEGSGTRVTWTMEGTNVYLMKVMGMFTNMDRLMGRHFETGLKNLGSLAEQAPG